MPRDIEPEIDIRPPRADNAFTVGYLFYPIEGWCVHGMRMTWTCTPCQRYLNHHPVIVEEDANED